MGGNFTRDIKQSTQNELTNTRGKTKTTYTDTNDKTTRNR